MRGPFQTATQLAAKRTQQPRTILAFLAVILGVTVAGGVAAVSGLAATEQSVYLIPLILLTLLALSVVVVGFVLWFAIKDPSKLQLGQVTATEYVAIQSWRRGDSLRGEFIELTEVSEPIPSAEADQAEDAAGEADA